jgi:large subunit ribosomal protein L6
MSRIGKAPIEVPAGVTVQVEPGRVAVSGPLGSLQQVVPQRMKIEQNGDTITVTRPTERAPDRELHGLTRTLVANMVEGVTKGFEKKLEIQGVGYRAALKGEDLELQVGYSHTVTIKPIRKVRPPEPYKGKGIRYEGEYVRRKVGKRA